MNLNTKERILSAINTVVDLDNYDPSDCIFSQKYNIVPVNMAYILIKLSEDFKFDITDDFVDALENCSFSQLEALLERYSDTRVINKSAG